MDRRAFVSSLALSILAAPLAAEAQPPIRIGTTLSQNCWPAVSRRTAHPYGVEPWLSF